MSFMVNIGKFEAGVYVIIIIILIIINAIIIVKYATSKRNDRPGLKAFGMVILLDLLIILPIVVAMLTQCIKT